MNLEEEVIALLRGKLHAEVRVVDRQEGNRAVEARDAELIRAIDCEIAGRVAHKAAGRGGIGGIRRVTGIGRYRRKRAADRRIVGGAAARGLVVGLFHKIIRLHFRSGVIGVNLYAVQLNRLAAPVIMAQIGRGNAIRYLHVNLRKIGMLNLHAVRRDNQIADDGAVISSPDSNCLVYGDGVGACRRIARNLNHVAVFSGFQGINQVFVVGISKVQRILSAAYKRGARNLRGIHIFAELFVGETVYHAVLLFGGKLSLRRADFVARVLRVKCAVVGKVVAAAQNHMGDVFIGGIALCVHDADIGAPASGCRGGVPHGDLGRIGDGNAQLSGLFHGYAVKQHAVYAVNVGSVTFAARKRHVAEGAALQNAVRSVSIREFDCGYVWIRRGGNNFQIFNGDIVRADKETGLSVHAVRTCVNHSGVALSADGNIALIRVDQELIDAAGCKRSLAEIQRTACGKIAEGFAELSAAVGFSVRGNNLIISYGGKNGGIGSSSLHIGSDESDCTAQVSAGIFDAAPNRGLYHRHRARVVVDHAAGYGGFLHADGAFSDVLHIAADGTAVDAEAGSGRLIDDAAGDAGVMQLQRRVAAVGGRCRLRQVGDFYNIALNFRAVYRDGNRSVVVAVVRDCVSVFILDFLRSDAGHVFV